MYKKIISLSIFNSPFENEKRVNWYWHYLPSVIRAYRYLLPDWTIRVYTDASIYNAYYGGVLLSLAEAGLIEHVIVAEKSNGYEGLLWRLLPIFDPEVEYTMCRDIDHTPLPREREMVQQFVQSGDLLHCIYDHPQQCFPIQAGLCGFKGNPTKFNSLSDITKLCDLSKRTCDQDFMAEHIWPGLVSKSFLHRTGWKKPETLASHCVFDVENTETSFQFAEFLGCPTARRQEMIHFYDENTNTEPIRATETRAGLNHEFYWESPSRASIHTKKAVFSCTDTDIYEFFMPIISKAWGYMGFCPVVLIAGYKKDWLSNPKSKWVLDETRKAGADIFFVDPKNGKLSTVAQVSRLYACTLGYEDDTYLMTTDVDLLPLSKSWFNFDPSKKVNIWYANAYNRNQFPMCHIGADVSNWKVIMNPAGTISNSIVMPEGQDWDSHWWNDERLVTKNIKANIPENERQYIDRHFVPPMLRMDRVCWSYNGKIADYADAHLPRPGFSMENWNLIQQPLNTLFVETDRAWAAKYYERFMSYV